MAKVVVLLSGGIDSTTVAAKAMAEGHQVIGLTIHYGQQNAQELAFAQKIASQLGIKESYLVKVNLSQWSESTLTIPANVRITDKNTTDDPSDDYVPGRNTVFIAIAVSLAQSQGAEYIYLGFNKADTLYPDTNLAYLEAFNQLMAILPEKELSQPTLVAPFLHDDKISIIRQALELGVPIEHTWSCYRGGDQPCGLCNACRIRDFALIKLGRPELATLKGRELFTQGCDLTTRLFWRFMLRD